jgi:XTP/dITP diphosphohydrolase|tara:strand:- start:1850 stop:2455 length:606 start_codon:yes stop_codon:yes gene_type:complete
MKKIRKILIGTHNKGKFKEISCLLSKKIKKISPIVLKIKSPKETGKNFKENSILKANYFNKKTNLISLSDDSGLQVKCLNNRPGIYSARWAKKHGSFNKAMQKILVLVRKENKLKKRKNRKATFVCCLSIKFLNKKIISVEGKINGILSEQIKGKNGFGYDSIFIPQGKKLTFGQMNKRKKMQIDHRYIAFKKLKKKIKIL